MVWSYCCIWASLAETFWKPKRIQPEDEIQKSDFKDNLNTAGSSLENFPPDCHNKNAIDSKHRVIKDIFVRFCFELTNDNPKGADLQVSQNIQRSIW